MKIREIERITKYYFGYEDIAKVLGISLSSAKVTANRYVKYGFLVRLKRNIYMLREKWNAARREDRFMLANLIQVPSYISLMTALDYYEITTQIQQDFFECVAVKRTKETNIGRTVFKYTKIVQKLYFGFEKKDDFFIALPEKAFLDALYLKSYGRYDFDEASIDFGKFNRKTIKRFSKKFPEKTQKALKNYEYFGKA